MKIEIEYYQIVTLLHKFNYKVNLKEKQQNRM